MAPGGTARRGSSAGPPGRRRRRDFDWRLAVLIAVAVWGAIGLVVLLGHDSGNSVVGTAEAPATTRPSPTTTASTGSDDIPAVARAGVRETPDSTIDLRVPAAPRMVEPIPDPQVVIPPTVPTTVAVTAAPAPAPRPAATAVPVGATSWFPATAQLGVAVPAKVNDRFGPRAQVLGVAAEPRLRTVAQGPGENAVACVYRPEDLPTSVTDGEVVRLPLQVVANAGVTSGEEACRVALQLRAFDCDDGGEVSCVFASKEYAVKVP